MQRESLEISLRDATGKGPARRLRAIGRVPAVVYGSGVTSTKITVDGHRLEEVLHHGANILLDLAGPIGGLNFQAAFATAELAARAVSCG